MLRLPPLRLLQPRTVEEAAAMLADGGRGSAGPVRLAAGGTDLFPNLKRRQLEAGTVLSLRRVGELRGIEGAPRSEMRIGATTTLSEIVGSRRLRERYPALGRAAADISAPALRNVGTLGGNLCIDTRCSYYNQGEAWRRAIGYCKKRGGETCWVAPSSERCWAVSSGDTAPVLCALGARAHLVSAQGERTVAVSDLYRDDGIQHLRLRADEILIAVLLPEEADRVHCRSAFLKLRRRGAIDFAALSVAACLWCDGERVERASIVLGAVASRPLHVPAAEGLLVGKALDETAILEAAHRARQAATPLDNTDLTAQWRGKAVERYVAAALRECAAA